MRGLDPCIHLIVELRDVAATDTGAISALAKRRLLAQAIEMTFGAIALNSTHGSAGNADTRPMTVK